MRNCQAFVKNKRKAQSVENQKNAAVQIRSVMPFLLA